MLKLNFKNSSVSSIRVYRSYLIMKFYDDSYDKIDYYEIKLVLYTFCFITNYFSVTIVFLETVVQS